jgi:hypothetical protein
MANVALIDKNNKVVTLNVINNEDLPDNGDFTPKSEKAAQEIQESLGLTPKNHKWLLTSINNNFRGKCACIGDTYDPDLDIFVGRDIFENIEDSEVFNPNPTEPPTMI